MNQNDRKKIDFLLSSEELLSKIDLSLLWQKLLENKIFNRDDINIPTWQVLYILFILTITLLYNNITSFLV